MKEILKKIAELKEKFEDSEKYLGIRFSKNSHEVGDSISISKGNPDREDSRDFPEFGSEEYGFLPDLPGTSAYDVDYWEEYVDLSDCRENGIRVYVISGIDYVEGEDRDEIILKNAEIVGILI